MNGPAATDARGSAEKPSAAVRKLDLAKLEAMRERAAEWGIKSVVVMQDGAMAWEWHEAGRDKPTAIYSCTKSVLSLLVGIALGDGLIGGVDDPIGDYLPLPAEGHPKLRAIRVRHLLAMTPGFDWPDFDKPYKTMKGTDDWVRFVLSMPIVHEPGEAFTYNSGGSHLLAAILTRATGRSVFEFAFDRLFGPLGIRHARWSGQNGIHEGGTGLQLRAADLAKIGMLCAQGGLWEGRRIVPAGWIAESTSPVTKGLVNYKPPIYGCYGYHWWVSTGHPEHVPDYYFAFGYGGQYLAVAPSVGVSAVVRKSLAGRNDAIKSRSLLHDYILSAVGAGH